MVVFKRHKTNYVKKEISSRINMIEIRVFLGVFPLFHTKSSVLTMELSMEHRCLHQKRNCGGDYAMLLRKGICRQIDVFRSESGSKYDYVNPLRAQYKSPRHIVPK